MGKEIRAGGGHYVCSKCGETVFGSKIHHCEHEVFIHTKKSLSTESKTVKYKRKSGVVEVMQLVEPNTPEDIMQFCPTATCCGVGAVGEKMWMEITTHKGIFRADYGDYLVRDENGEFCPYKPIIFEMMYEKVEE